MYLYISLVQNAQAKFTEYQHHENPENSSVSEDILISIPKQSIKRTEQQILVINGITLLILIVIVLSSSEATFQ
jgi:hypothetical protein